MFSSLALDAGEHAISNVIPPGNGGSKYHDAESATKRYFKGFTTSVRGRTVQDSHMYCL